MAQVRTRKRGKTFSYIFEAGKKADGRRNVVEKGGFATKAEAYKAGVAAYNDFLHGNIGITSEKITLKDFMSAWLDNVVSANVKISTLQNYQFYLKVNIAPHLGNMKVQDLTPAMLDAWIRKLVELGFSYSSMRVAYSIILEALDYAVYPAQLIQSNPAAYIKVPKNAPRNLVKRTIISDELLAKLLSEYPCGSPFHVPIAILFCTGIRIGELVGLTWDDVDFERKLISVRKQLTYVSKRGQVFAPPKSNSGIRKISVGDALLDLLATWRTLQKRNEVNHGNTYARVYRSDNNVMLWQSKGAGILNLPHVELICTQEDGRPLNRRSLMRLLKDNGVNVHSFRHTQATILAENGAHPRRISRPPRSLKNQRHVVPVANGGDFCWRRKILTRL